MLLLSVNVIHERCKATPKVPFLVFQDGSFNENENRKCHSHEMRGKVKSPISNAIPVVRNFGFRLKIKPMFYIVLRKIRCESIGMELSVQSSQC